MSLFRLFQSTCGWLSALILALLPIVVALDYGGVLRWTHYVAGLAALVAIVCAVASLNRSDFSGGLRRHMLLIPMVAWLGFALFQTIPLPSGVVHFLSPASAEAYTEWINPLLPEAEQLSSFPISIGRHDSLHVCALLGVLIAVAWASAMLFHERSRIVLLLIAISVGASLHSGIGLWRMVIPETEAWSVATDTAGSAFGAFVNRNNAALMLNFGLAFSLGLLAWRLTALNDLRVDDPSFELNDLVSLTGDRDSLVGLIGAVLCIAGLLVCGSRGGLTAACLGLLLAFGWIRQRRGLVSIPVVGTMVAIGLALLLVPLDLNLESIQRFELFSQQDSSTILQDGRLLHWRDGLDAAGSHLPMGSGLSTYAYAYLPHQQTSPHAWFHHADNLWLELITEQGVVGITLALSIIIITVIALQRLGNSPDPIDHGLRITGWYCLGAIVVSQLFDFGLIALGNLLVVAVLLPAIVSRASGVTVSASPTNANLFATHRQRILVASVACVSLVLVCVSLPTLKQNAAIESLSRTIDMNLEVSSVSANALAQWSEQLDQIAGASPTSSALSALTNVEYHRARLADAIASNPKDIEQFQQRFRETGHLEKRLVWRNRHSNDEAAIPATFASNVDSLQRAYGRPFELATRSLKELPLSSDARWMILYLDFVHRDPRVTLAALEQLRQLHGNNPSMLIRIGQFAADSGQVELAADVWGSALNQRPSLTSKVFELLDQYAELNASQVLPQNPENLRQAVPYLLRDVAKNHETLVAALDEMDCDTCETLATRSRCEELSGDVAYALGRCQDAYDDYRKAMTFDAANANLRLKMIRRLRESGRRQEARLEARSGRLANRDDTRFDAIIAEMAKSDLEEITHARSE